MSNYLFCRSCGTAQPSEKFSDYIEEDVNYHGLRCECGAIDDFEEMDAEWAGAQIKKTYRTLRLVSKDPYMLDIANRLSAAEDVVAESIDELTAERDALREAVDEFQRRCLEKDGQKMMLGKQLAQSQAEVERLNVAIVEHKNSKGAQYDRTDHQLWESGNE